MRVLVAPDSFGGTLSAVEAAEAIAAGLRAAGDLEVDLAPMSDGGPGFVDVLHAALAGEVVTLTVADPLGRPVRAAYLRVGEAAYVESAQAAGLHLVAPAERDPVRASTRGVGELLGHALDAGARRVVVGLGGSATSDGGAGLVAALGGLRAAAERCRAVDLVAASDVDNPLLGPQGAVSVFGPQKGVTREQLPELERRLAAWAAEITRELGCDVRDLPGAGAAGGMGAALLALGARRVPGIELVTGAVRLGERVAQSSLVITGEGSFDEQSLRGKVVAGVAALAGAAGVPCLVLAGQVRAGRRETAAAGVDAAYGLVEYAGSEERAKAQAPALLTALAERVARDWCVRP